jgi:hypothetical protein
MKFQTPAQDNGGGWLHRVRVDDGGDRVGRVVAAVDHLERKRNGEAEAEEHPAGRGEISAHGACFLSSGAGSGVHGICTIAIAKWRSNRTPAMGSIKRYVKQDDIALG